MTRGKWEGDQKNKNMRDVIYEGPYFHHCETRHRGSNTKNLKEEIRNFFRIKIMSLIDVFRSKTTTVKIKELHIKVLLRGLRGIIRQCRFHSRFISFKVLLNRSIKQTKNGSQKSTIANVFLP